MIRCCRLSILRTALSSPYQRMWTDSRRTVFGLVERALYVATIAWLLTAAFGLTG